ncbi:glycosyltransferase [Halalkalibacter wakoensis JCM 9140]|uniref:Glycosyltransferase n=2 Tax=Halalkalibacter wakoensis TaxID=127891 RepID=W4Q8N4_9BACI|nr:glycosyltransferase [Halalkalibacter wakoensis JCM 9140]
MPKIDEGLAQHDDLISILIPLRNEERNVPGLVQSLKELHDQNIEVLFLDDHSSDQTYNLLTELTKDRKNFHVRKGKPLPANWVGKVHACHQLSALAKGDYLFL